MWRCITDCYLLTQIHNIHMHTYSSDIYNNSFESFVRMDVKRRARLCYWQRSGFPLAVCYLLHSSITNLALLGFIALPSFWQVYVGAGVSHSEQPAAQQDVPGESWLQLVSLALAHMGTWVLTVLWKIEVDNLFGFLVLEDNSMCIKSDSVCSLKAKIAPDGLLYAKWDLKHRPQ